MPGYTDNPIDNDNRLASLVSDISNIKSEKAYNTWRKEFLRIYTKYLDKNGILNGKDANYRLLKQLQKLDKRIELFRPVLEQQAEGDSIHSTNGRRLLTNLTNEVVATEQKVQELLPKTAADEERFGFDKFELAAVLLEDGFAGYDAMNASRYILESIAPHIQGHDAHHRYSNEVAILHQYSDAVESFVKVMEDLKVINIMNHCVDVVYKGTKRPEPKPPPPPEEAEEDTSICSDSDGDSQHYENNYSSNKVPKRSGSKYDKYDREAAPTDSPTKPTKKKKKPATSKSSTKDSAAEPSKKKKQKKPKKKGGKGRGAIAGDDDDDDDSIHQEMDQHEANDKPRGLSSSSYKPKSPRKKPKGSPSKSSRRGPDYNDEEDDDTSGNSDSDESEEEEEEEDEDQNQGGPPEFLLYFDPKTNSIGKIPLDVAAKSSLIIDQDQQESAQGAYSSECYKNVMESQDEKQQLIFLLKKLERSKPQEESWLDKIKREKEEEAAKGGGANKHKKFHKSTARISRRNSNSNANANATANSNATNASGTTFKIPLGGSSSSSSKKGVASKGKSLSNKSKYKQVAEKPDSSGWSKPTSSRGLLQ